MPVNTQIVFRHMEPSEALTALVKEKAEWLESFGGGITHCRVVVDASRPRHRPGAQVKVDVQLHVPGEEIIVSRRPRRPAHTQDAYSIVHDAFDAARRQLEDYLRRRRHETKHHETQWNVGHVADVFMSDGFGFIEGLSGERVYFHRNSVEGNHYAQLKRDTPVYFMVEPGLKGPQATIVRLISNQSHTAAAPALPRHRFDAAW